MSEFSIFIFLSLPGAFDVGRMNLKQTALIETRPAGLFKPGSYRKNEPGKKINFPGSEIKWWSFRIKEIGNFISLKNKFYLSEELVKPVAQFLEPCYNVFTRK
jgi:hypothetical protein